MLDQIWSIDDPGFRFGVRSGDALGDLSVIERHVFQQPPPGCGLLCQNHVANLTTSEYSLPSNFSLVRRYESAGTPIELFNRLVKNHLAACPRPPPPPVSSVDDSGNITASDNDSDGAGEELELLLSPSTSASSRAHDDEGTIRPSGVGQSVWEHSDTDEDDTADKR